MTDSISRNYEQTITSLLRHVDLLTWSPGKTPSRRALKCSKTQKGGDRLRLEHKSRNWEFSIAARRKKSQFWYGKLTGKYLGRKAGEFSLQMKFPLPDKGLPRWMIPGILYKENRPKACIRKFPYPRYDYHGGDVEKFESNYWAFRSDRCPVPAVISWVDNSCVGIATKEQSSLGVSGVGFEGSREQTCIYLNFPYREEPKKYSAGLEDTDPIIKYARIEPGDTFTCEFYMFCADDDLHNYNDFIRALYYEWHKDNPPNPWLATGQANDLLAYGLYNWHYDKKHHALYETAAFDANCSLGSRIHPGLEMRHVDRPHMHVGWVSGIPTAFALLWYGRDKKRADYMEAATKVIDKIANKGFSPIGCFWPEWTFENGWGTGWNPRPNWIHSRTISEATLFLVRALVFEKKNGVSHANWERAVRKNINFILKMQDEEGNFGTYYDVNTGKVIEKRGTGSILWIAALVEAGKYFGKTKWRAAAIRAAQYYSRFIEDEYLFGAPEDVHLTPTSEDGYNALISYCVLYESTKNDKWLALATKVADWLLTFRFTYNVKFPEHTFLNQYDFRTIGGDLASVSNQHIHNYGLVCVPEMLRLWKYTGDDYYYDRTRDMLLCFMQTISRKDGDMNARKGMVSEQWYTADWAFHKGSMTQVSHAWCMGLATYAHKYINDFGSVFVYPEAEKVYSLEPVVISGKRVGSLYKVEIANPFEYELTLRIRIAGRAGKVSCRKIRLDPGEAKSLSFAS